MFVFHIMLPKHSEGSIDLLEVELDEQQLQSRRLRRRARIVQVETVHAWPTWHGHNQQTYSQPFNHLKGLGISVKGSSAEEVVPRF